jgi:Tfp pilus assembly protein PilV
VLQLSARYTPEERAQLDVACSAILASSEPTALKKQLVVDLAVQFRRTRKAVEDQLTDRLRAARALQTVPQNKASASAAQASAPTSTAPPAKRRRSTSNEAAGAENPGVSSAVSGNTRAGGKSSTQLSPQPSQEKDPFEKEWDDEELSNHSLT